MNNLTRDSKRLAYLLRYSNLPDRNGWVRVSTVLSELTMSLHDIQKIVNGDTKVRFEFSADESAVRALYGHSIDVDLELKPTPPPAVLYHGTAKKYLNDIMKHGLKPRKRNCVHLSETTDMAMQVGARHDSPAVLAIDTDTMITAGRNFYKAQNGIWLTSEISTRFFKVICYE